MYMECRQERCPCNFHRRSMFTTSVAKDCVNFSRKALRRFTSEALTPTARHNEYAEYAGVREFGHEGVNVGWNLAPGTPFETHRGVYIFGPVLCSRYSSSRDFCGHDVAHTLSGAIEDWCEVG